MRTSPHAGVTGLVYDIQRYSLGDGPGIRTTVFLKGCPLKCAWCQNPESINPSPEIGFRSDRCMDCRACLDACPKDAILLEEPRRIDPETCDACGDCVGVCPTRALFSVGRRYGVTELLCEVQRDAAFYEESGGGLTLSGGEPTLQFDFVHAFLQACKTAGLNTAIETNGHTSKEKLATLLPYLDSIFFDLKIISRQEHRRLTGADNQSIIRNARLLVESGAPVTFRMPVIPGMTATTANIQAIAEFLHELGVEEIEVCPYQGSWLNKLSWFPDLQPPRNLPVTMSSEELQVVIEAFLLDGIQAKSVEGEAVAF